MMNSTAVAATTETLTANLTACAKINLTLEVKRRREDGYHEIRSLAVGAGLFDRMWLRSAPAGVKELRCSEPSLNGEANLAARAARLLVEETGWEGGWELFIEKSIPIGGGLGGGSSDAAAALMLCNRAWSTGVSAERLMQLAAALGSDVPLFFRLPCVLLAGRGERVESVRTTWSGWALLVMAGVEASTAEVYARWDDLSPTLRGDETPHRCASASTAEEFMEHSFNDLEPAIFDVAPQVGRVYQQLWQHGLGPIRVSGAGSVIYRLFDDHATATRAQQHLRELGIGTRCEVVPVPARFGPILLEGDYPWKSVKFESN